MLLVTASTIAAILLGGYAAKLGGLGPAGGNSTVRPAVMRSEPFTEVDAAIGKTWRDFQGLSPDGTKALIGDYTKGQNFGVYDFPTHNFKLLTDLDWSTYWVCCGAWSPQSDAVAYEQTAWAPNVPVEIHVASLDRPSRMIFRYDEDPGRAAVVDGWFPDASKVLVRLGRTDGSGAIGTVPSAGGPFTQIRALKWSDWFDRPALSPDGQFVAFAEPENGGSREIRVVSVDGRGEYRITDHPADDFRPLWSPDGRHLAFISNRAGSAALWAVPMNGGEPAGTPFKIKDGMQDVSPLNWNARGIVYSQDTRTWDVFTSVRETAATGAWATPRQLPYDRTGRNMAATWSPDGHEIALLAGEPGEESRRYVVVKPVDGGPAREYRIPSTRLSLFTYDLRWFGNGQGLGFSGNDSEGKTAVFRLTLATGEWQVVPLNTKMWTRIEWNDDGSRFYFARFPLERDAPPGIYERDVKKGTERAIYPSERFNTIRGLKLSANRQWLAFLQWWEEDKHIANGTVVVINVATGEQRKLTTIRSGGPELNVRALAWAPGDTAVVLLVSPAGRRDQQLQLAPLNGGPVSVLQDVHLPSLSHSLISGFDWSPDGRHLAFVVNDVPSSVFVIENPLADAPPRVTTVPR